MPRMQEEDGVETMNIQETTLDSLTSGAYIQKATKKGKPIYDCKKCGVCCGAFFVGPAGIMRVEISSDDIKRLPLAFRKHLVKYGDGQDMIKAVMRGGKPRCPALRGRLRRNPSCAIYSRRPFNCRYFEPDDITCRMARFEYGMPLKPQPTLAGDLEKIEKMEELSDEVLPGDTQAGLARRGRGTTLRESALSCSEEKPAPSHCSVGPR